MANISNLRPGEYKLSVEEAKKGGIASGEARRRKKTLREKAKLLMSLSIQDQNELLKAKELGLNTEDIDIEMMNLIHMLNIIKKENFCDFSQKFFIYNHIYLLNLLIFFCLNTLLYHIPFQYIFLSLHFFTSSVSFFSLSSSSIL